MLKKNLHLPTNTKQALTAYYRGLQLFFTNNGEFKQARSILKELFYYAFSENIIPKKEEIPALRSLQKKFIELMETTYKVYHTGVGGTIALEQDVFSYAGHPKSEYYCDQSAGTILSPWEYYPRFISKQEFINPHGFFEKFFVYKELFEWKSVLEELFHAALLHQSVMDFSDDINNAIVLQDYLFKFLEVSHLIKVRHSDN